MYERFWNLERPPFENDLNPEFYFPARSHQGALLKLRFALEHRKGVALLVGEHGVGKTYLTQLLEQEADGPDRPFLRLLFPQLSPTDMLNYLAHRLGAIPTPGGLPATTDQVLRNLEDRLEWMAHSETRRVIVLDDAHLLQAAHFETLQLLMSVQQQAGNVLSLILVGRPELLSRVERAPGLDQRVAVRMSIDSLQPDETANYLEHRLLMAGRSEAIYRDDAYRTIWEVTQGVPRVLNQIGDLSLLIGYADSLTELSSIEIEAAAEEMAAVSLD